jgi:integrase
MACGNCATVRGASGRNASTRGISTSNGRASIIAGEERRLLAAGSPRLQNIIIAALDTCCRRGELLTLQRRDLDLNRGELTIHAEKAKDRDTRVLPLSARLTAVLKMAKTGLPLDRNDSAENRRNSTVN